MGCKLDTLINEENESREVIETAKQAVEYKKRVQAGVNRATRQGMYADPDKRVSPYIDRGSELVGKTLTLQDMETNMETDVKVEATEMLSNNKVRINGEHDLKLDTGMLTDGITMATLGSEKGKRNTEFMGQLGGTIVNDLDTLATVAAQADGKPVSEQLKRVMNMYKDVLMKAGKDVKIDVELFKDLDNKGAMGKATVDSGKLKLIQGNTRFNSNSDILAHELQHILIHNVLVRDKVLTSQILRLRDAIAKEISWEVFLPDGDVTAEDKAFAKERWEYVFRNPIAEDQASEFLAAATTNEKLAEALGTVNQFEEYQIMGTMKIEPGTKSRWKKLWNNIAKIINQVYRNTKFKGKDAREITIDMLNKAMELGHSNRKVEEMTISERLLQKLDKIDSKVAELTTLEKKAQRSYADYIRQTENKSGLKKAIDKVWEIRGIAKAKSYILKNNIFASVTRDMSNKDVAKFYQMFRHAKAFVENAVAPIKHFTIEVLDKDYELGRLSKGERRAAKRVLIDTDAKVLGGSKQILKYLQDERRITAELNIFKHNYSKQVVDATEQLGKLLVDNSTDTANGYVNASQISYALLKTQNPKTVAEIDKMASLIALRYSAKENKDLVIQALTKELVTPEGKIVDVAKGFDHAMELMRTNEAKVLEDAYSGDTMYQIKGAKQEEYIGNKRYYIVEEKELKDLERAKMSNLGKQEALSEAVGKDMYLVVGESMEVGYTEGLMSKVQLKNEGDSLRRILMEVNELTDVEAEIVIDNMSKETAKVKGALIPERSGKNEIYDYRVRIPHEVKSKYLEIEDDILPTVGGTVSDLTHKQEAMISNKEAIAYFKRFHTKYESSRDYKFVEISENSEGKEKEYWDSIPYYLKAQIDKTMGGRLMVEESMLVDFFGYKDMSAMNLPMIKNSKRRQLVVRKAEKIVQELTQGWKSAVVAKTASTIIGNNGSNMVVALQHTKSKDPLKYLGRFTDMWSEMNKYQDDRRMASKLAIRREAGETIDEKELKNIENRMKNSPVEPLMKDGQYTAILEDLNTEWMNEKGIIEGKLDAVLDKLKRKNDKVGIKEVIDTLYVRKDSPLYDSTMKLTTYADVITKMIIYQDLMAEYNSVDKAEKNETFAGKLGGKDATEKQVEQNVLNYVDGLTVNYGYLDNRGIKYANDTLIFSFTKYFFRVFPAMMKMLSKKAGTVFITEGAQGVSGIDAETPWDQYYSPIDAILRKIGGWGDPINILKMITTPAVAK